MKGQWQQVALLAIQTSENVMECLGMIRRQLFFHLDVRKAHERAKVLVKEYDTEKRFVIN